ncbi:MAG TPA: HNH endonuclease signature motif containing protein, partial [Dermatophilaceae bacterium]|nr:HNH endonuclease signature motif containing protein [Dermatophilaceae bacterium]
GGPSQILDLGRQNRFFNEPQRTALATIYETCAAEDCDRPYAWSELHHEDPWSRGGLTDLDKAVPLCGYHHRKMHDPSYLHQITRLEHAPGAKTVHFQLR